MANFETKVKALFEQSADGTEFDVYTSIGAQLQLENRARLCIEKKTFPEVVKRFQLKEVLPFGPNKVLFSITLADLVEIGKKLGNAYMTVAGYRRVLVDPYWKQLFNVRDRDFAYIEGHDSNTYTMASLPCYQCGLVLPAEHITIDHVKPQAGGDEHAILKVFRGLACHLTLSRGHGQYANAFRNESTDPLPTKAGRMQQSSDYQKELRYTLSQKGVAVLSAFVAATSANDVSNACMHSAFNLRPYCAKCNIAKSNTLTDLSWIN